MQNPVKPTKVDSEKVLGWLNTHWLENKVCPVCQKSKWAVAPQVFELRPFYDGYIVMGNSMVVPVIPVSCENCGNTLFFNAVKMNVIDEKSQ